MNNRLAGAMELRNYGQHQIGEVYNLIENRGQMWGYITWAEVIENQYTGKWLMISPGAYYRGDTWLFIGPTDLPYPVPLGRTRLKAISQEVYLGRLVAAQNIAVRALEEDIARGLLHPVGDPATDRKGADLMIEGSVEVIIGNQ